jgi:hypothetical protein
MSQHVIWRGDCYVNVGDHATPDEGWIGSVLERLEGGERAFVRFGDPALIVDPTVDQWEAAKAGLSIPGDAKAHAELAQVVADLMHHRV